MTTALDALRELASYTRSLEEELDGPSSGEGEPLVRANALLADHEGGPPESDDDAEWGKCLENEGGPHRASLALCVYCLEYDA